MAAGSGDRKNLEGKSAAGSGRDSQGVTGEARRSFWHPANFGFEMRFTIMAVLPVFLALLFGGMVIYTVIRSGMQGLPFLSSPAAMVAHEKEILSLLSVVLAGSVLIVVMISALVYYRLMHHISGPMRRLEREMRRLARGQVPGKPFTLRRDDFFRGPGEAFNELISALEQKKIL